MKIRFERALRHLAAVLAVAAPASGATYDVTLDPASPALCDGSHDDRAAIQAAIALAAADGGGRVYIPTGTCRVSGALEIPSNGIVVFGDGAGSRIEVAAGGANLFSISNRSRITLRDLQLAEAGVTEHSQAGVGSGVLIRGNSDAITLRNLHITGFAHGILARELGPWQITHLTLRDVWVEHTSGWGIEITGVQNARLFDVRVMGAGSDGLKIGAPTRYLEVHGGRFWKNGAGGVGDGIDLHSGGNKWLIAGTRTDGNRTEGINVKSGDSPVVPAPIGEGAIVGVISEHNGVNGINIFSSPGAPSEDPTPQHIRITGGVIARNDQSGIRIGAGRNVTLSGVVVKENDEYGILISKDSFDISIVGAQVSANGSGPLNNYAGIDVSGDRVRMLGGVVNGNNDDVAVGDPCSVATPACPASHATGLRIDPDASDTFVSGTILENTNSGTLLRGAGVIEDVVGFATEASGIRTLAGGTTSVVVAHGLATTPTLAQLSATPVSDWGNAGRYWISAPSELTFRLNVDTDPGVDVDFRWRADASGR
jgi:hypothetical protein